MNLLNFWDSSIWNYIGTSSKVPKIPSSVIYNIGTQIENWHQATEKYPCREHVNGVGFFLTILLLKTSFDRFFLKFHTNQTFLTSRSTKW